MDKLKERYGDFYAAEIDAGDDDGVDAPVKVAPSPTTWSCTAPWTRRRLDSLPLVATEVGDPARLVLSVRS